MWVFLFLLALVPLFFFWTDAAVDLIPKWQGALPQSKNSTLVAGADVAEGQTLDVKRRAGEAVPWVEANSEKGFAAYLISPDDQYRLVVGCQTEQPATLHVTLLSGAPITATWTLDYEYGQLPVVNGSFQGDLLLSAVSQMSKVVLLGEDGKPLAQFNTTVIPSESVARQLAQVCAR